MMSDLSILKLTKSMLSEWMIGAKSSGASVLSPKHLYQMSLFHVLKFIYGALVSYVPGVLRI